MTGRIALWLFITGILVCPSSGMANDLSLSEAVNLALSRNYTVQAARYKVLSSREKITQARSGAIPQVQISEQLAHTTNPMWAFGTKLNQQTIATSDFNPDRLNDPDAITNYATVLSVLWPIYDQGQTWYGLAQAKLNQEAEGVSEVLIKQQVIAGTTTAYYQVLLAQENQRVLTRIIETAGSHLKLVQSRYDGGFVAKSDLLRAQVHVADLKQQMMEIQTQVDIARCNLNISMGMDSNLQYILTSPLKVGESVTGDLDFWVNTALLNRQELRQLNLQRQIAQKEIDKSRALRHPSVSLSGNYEVNSEDFGDTAANYTVGGMVSVPLFSGGQVSSKIREAQINLKQIQSLIKSTEQQVCAQARQAFLNAHSAWSRISVARAAIDQSEESLRIVKNRYTNGLFTIADLLDAEVMVQQSLTAHLKAIHDYKLALTRLDLASGTIESSQETQP